MATERDALRAALDALEEIALAGMSGSGQESEEGMRDWHARRAWEFIGIAARALGPARAALAAPPVEQPSIEDLCARIKAADDAAADGDYMLDSDDCIRVLRGTWTGPLAMDKPEQPAPQASRVWRGGGTLTVADLVNNLLMMDQALPIYGAQYIEHNGRRGPIAVHPTVSRERVADGRWIGEGKELNAAVIWTRAEQPAPQAGAWCSACGCGNDVCGYAHLPGCLRAAQAQGGSNG